MKLKIEIQMDNAAFEDGAGIEAARILKALAEDFQDRDLLPGEMFRLRDVNGNKVGEAKVTR